MMKLPNLTQFLVASVASAMVLAGCDKPVATAAVPQRGEAVAASRAEAAAEGRVVHVVSFKFKPTASAAQVAEVVDAFKRLRTLSVDADTGRPLIKSFRYGTNNSLENVNKGFTHCFILTFANLADRDYYVGNDHAKPFDPAHERFKQLVGPLLDGGADGVFVFDFTNGTVTPEAGPAIAR